MGAPCFAQTPNVPPRGDTRTPLPSKRGNTLGPLRRRCVAPRRKRRPHPSPVLTPSVPVCVSSLRRPSAAPHTLNSSTRHSRPLLISAHHSGQPTSLRPLHVSLQSEPTDQAPWSVPLPKAAPATAMK
ncbi:telomerase reverse transcriptase-like [Symphalangus syndactylus]|uniref:telomerase reverse transcriptase-like n=1 Tax=Symphalangus syndactylus TaxID=9590 RepID=UPI003004917A